MAELTQERIRELFDYRDGNLYWKRSKAHCVEVGDRAGTSHPNGYRKIQINGKQYFAHRLIFLYHHGYLPEFLDHIDSEKSNNEISNLREATHQENHRNQKKRKHHNGKPTSSRFKCVCWNKRAKKWMAYITIKGKQKHLGYYDLDSEIDAALAYDRAAIELDGEFALTNAMMFP